MLNVLRRLKEYFIKEKSSYPEYPELYYKIAIFGSSAAAGLSAERGFGALLQHELKTFQNKKIYIKNYAESGVTFHNYQAEIAKNVINQYDMIIIFAGNNETISTLYDNHFFGRRNPLPGLLRVSLYYAKLNLKQKRNIKENLFYLFISQLYQIGKAKLNAKRMLRIDKKESLMVDVKPKNSILCINKEIEDVGVVPENKWHEINTNFQKSLNDIAELATKKQVKIIIASLPTDESHPPFLSVFKPEMSQDDKLLFKKCYKKAVNYFHQKRYQEAKNLFNAAHQMDSGVAILNYYLGMTLRALKENEMSWKYLRQAVNHCGFRLRYPDVFRKISSDIAQTYTHVTFIDCIDIFHQLIDQGLQEESLFSDCQHPTMLGHIAICHTILAEMNQCKLSLTPIMLQELSEKYQHELQIKQHEKTQIYLLNARWHLSLVSFVACKKYCLDKADHRFNSWWQETNHVISMEQQIEYLVYKAVIALNQNKVVKAVSYLNEAVRKDKKTVVDMLHRPGWMGSHYARSIFMKMGFDEKAGQFYYE